MSSSESGAETTQPDSKLTQSRKEQEHPPISFSGKSSPDEGNLLRRLAGAKSTPPQVTQFTQNAVVFVCSSVYPCRKSFAGLDLQRVACCAGSGIVYDNNSRMKPDMFILFPFHPSACCGGSGGSAALRCAAVVVVVVVVSSGRRGEGKEAAAGGALWRRPAWREAGGGAGGVRILAARAGKTKVDIWIQNSGNFGNTALKPVRRRREARRHSEQRAKKNPLW